MSKHTAYRDVRIVLESLSIPDSLPARYRLDSPGKAKNFIQRANTFRKGYRATHGGFSPWDELHFGHASDDPNTVLIEMKAPDGVLTLADGTPIEFADLPPAAPSLPEDDFDI